MWPWSWTSIMTLNLDFRVQIFNYPYLRKGKVDLRCGTRFANSNSGVNHGLTLISFSRSYFEIVLFQVWMDRLKWNKRVMNRRYAYPVCPPPFSMILTLDVLGWIKKITEKSLQILYMCMATVFIIDLLYDSRFKNFFYWHNSDRCKFQQRNTRNTIQTYIQLTQQQQRNIATQWCTMNIDYKFLCIWISSFSLSEYIVEMSLQQYDIASGGQWRPRMYFSWYTSSFILNDGVYDVIESINFSRSSANLQHFFVWLFRVLWNRVDR